MTVCSKNSFLVSHKMVLHEFSKTGSVVLSCSSRNLNRRGPQKFDLIKQSVNVYVTLECIQIWLRDQLSLSELAEVLNYKVWINHVTL